MDDDDVKYDVTRQERAIINVLKQRAEAQVTQPRKAYILRFFIQGNNLCGADLKKIFLSHSIEEAILKMNDYLIDQTQDCKGNPISLLYSDPEAIYELDTDILDEINEYIDSRIKNLENNHTLWIEEYGIIQ